MASLLKELPSMTTILSVYASLSGLSMLIRTILNEMIPRDRWQAVENETFRAVEVYLPTKVGPSTKSLLL
ncbi:hypothetical protein OIU84_030125, partial [Salix udensis]